MIRKAQELFGVAPKPELIPFDTILQRQFANTKWLYTFDLRFDEILRRRDTAKHFFYQPQNEDP